MADPLAPELLPFATTEERGWLLDRVLSADDEETLLAELTGRLEVWRRNLRPTQDQLLQVTHEENRMHVRSGRATPEFWKGLDTDWRRKQKPTDWQPAKEWSPDARLWFEEQQRAGNLFTSEEAADAAYVARQRPDSGSETPSPESQSETDTAKGLDALHKLLPHLEPPKPTLGQIIGSLQPEKPESLSPVESRGTEGEWPNDKWSLAERKWLETQRSSGITYSNEKDAKSAYLKSLRPELPSSSRGETLGEYLPRALRAVEAEQEASQQRLGEQIATENREYPPPLVEYFKEQERRHEAAEKARIAGLEQAFDNALRRQEDRRPSQRETAVSADKLSVEFWAETKKNRGWLVPIFLLSGLPLFIATVWGPIMGSKTIPDWLAENGWPRLTILLLGWVAGVTIIALAIVARSYLIVRERRRTNKRDLTTVEIGRKLKDYQDVGERILKRCAREALAPVVQIINWQDEVEAYIRDNVGEFQSIEFSKSAPITVYPNQACNRDLTNKLYTQIERIGQIISELRRS